MATTRRLPILCPSNDGPPPGDPNGDRTFHTSGCKPTCTFWKKGCQAGLESTEMYQQWYTTKRDENMPACPIASTCRWNIDAVKRGEAGCLVRRLGLICEHQGGEWNTFQMAEPDDECWGEDYAPEP